MTTLGTEVWKGHSTATVPFGLRDGRLWFVTDVEPGLACNCRCPDPQCDQPLVARNRHFESRKRAYHFMHANKSASCGGRESALHRMAKEILLRAEQLRLPAWSGGEVTLGAEMVALHPGSRAEVRLLNGQTRPDVSAWVLATNELLAEVHVEVRVNHAVDDAKALLAAANGLTMIEIDLSEVSDELVQDQESFIHAVLDDPSNRSWISLTNADLLSSLIGTEVLEVTEIQLQDRHIPFRSGKGHWLHTQQAVVSHVTGRPPWATFIELERFVGNSKDPIDASGRTNIYTQPAVTAGDCTDGAGTRVPYAPGLYLRGLSTNRYKTRLMPISNAGRFADTRSQRDLFCT